MEKANERMKKGARNGKNPMLQRNLPSSHGNLLGLKTIRTAKRKKTRAALMLGKPETTRGTLLQTRRRRVKGLNQRIDCCILREDTRRLHVWLSKILGFDRSQHICSSAAYLFGSPQAGTGSSKQRQVVHYPFLQIVVKILEKICSAFHL
uniref:HDGF like 3 n=1 Tax=Salvator merianae TaxID=96440 RepID=A0A8D0BFF8_SALMN